MSKHACCTSLPNIPEPVACGVTSPLSPFKVWIDSNGKLAVVNRKGENVTEYFNVALVDGVVVMNYKKDPSLEEWRKIVGKG